MLRTYVLNEWPLFVRVSGRLLIVLSLSRSFHVDCSVIVMSMLSFCVGKGGCCGLGIGIDRGRHGSTDVLGGGGGAAAKSKGR